ncbi:hypothetical protein IT882_00950 [Microbacterium schleiferi]|uniref:Uncharacterized protein n=1 Tax=Microbacterium schleiferi TaxID=69362 RepID=A0A7S8RHW2_9MICO|nr:hypothetical protein [Microbacterium schleiferi]QPE04761.1 hypothetical protein IT882_00950 [Microbacterium schleiferi]
MRVDYDEVVQVERLERPMSAPHIERANGFAVRLEDQWFWFSGLEAAYTFGRAGRMSIQVRNWDLVEAATEARFDHPLRRDVFTLYVVEGRGFSVMPTPTASSSGDSQTV